MSNQWPILFAKLTKLTESGRLKWDEDPIEYRFYTALSEFDIEISFDDFDESFAVIIKSKLGKKLDSFDDNDLTRAGVVGAFGMFEKLVTNIRRHNSGAEKVLSKLIEQLGDEDI